MEAIESRRLNPFPGLRPFRSDEHHLFFGREEQTAALLQLLRANRFLAVVGTSGSGKSSLVRAGLIAALHGGTMTQAGSNWEVVILRPGGNPIENLARAMIDADLYEAEDSSTLPRLRATLNRSRFGLVEAMKQSGVFASGVNLLVVVDQFEELFRFRQQGVDSEETAAAFVNLLLTASSQAECPIFVTVTMRSDYLGECSEIPGLAEAVNQGEYLIPRLLRDQKRDAIEKPIGVGGARISPLLVQRLLNDVGDDPDQLPVLQHALMRMWDVWSAGNDHNRPIDFADFEATGGLASALSNHADEIYAGLSDDRHRLACERIFRTLTEKGEDNRGIRRPTRLARLQTVVASDCGTVTAVLDAFRASGVTFVMPGTEIELGEQTVIDLSHESLMRGWQRLRGWVESEAQSARIFRRLADTARLWSDGKAGLFRDPDLQIALSWREEQEPNTEWAEQYGGHFEKALGFLEASHAEARIERQTKEAARQRELEQARQLAEAQRLRLEHQQRAARKLRMMIAGLGIVALIAVGTSLVAGKFWHQANIAKLQAETSEELAKKNAARAQEEAIRANDQKGLAQENLTKAEKAQKEATEQRKRADDAAEFARQNLYYAQMHLTPQVWRGGHMSLIYMRELLASWRPQGDSRDQRGWEWFYLNSLPYQNLRILTESGKSGTPSTVAWHIPSRRLAEGTVEGLIRIWDVDREQTTLTLRGPAPWVQYWGGRWLAWSPDGSRLAAGFRDTTVRIWETKSGKQLKILRGHKAQVLSVAFSSDGASVAAWGVDGAIKIWNADSGQLTKEIVHPGNVGAGLWSPDDKLLACGHWDGTVTISSATNVDKFVTLGGSYAPISALAWSPDSSRLAATSSYDYAARIWDVASGKVVLGPLLHSHEAMSIAWEPSGKRLATGSIDETIKIWDANSGHEAVTLRGNLRAVTSLAWGPDGRLASGFDDGGVKVWNPIHDQESSELPAHAGRAHSVAWSPNGKRLASGGDDGKIRIWDSATRKEVQTLIGHDQGRVHGQFGLIRSLAWSPNGAQLASAGLDGTAKVWDVATGRELLSLPADHGSVWSVAWNADGSYLAAGSQDGTIRVVEGLKHTPKVTVVMAHLADSMGGVRTLAWSPKGDRLATGGADGLVKVWDPIRGVELVHSQERQSTIFTVAWSPDGKQLATGAGDLLVSTWDAQTGRKLQTMRGHHGWVEGVAWSPDGTRLASAAGDSSVRVWDPLTGEEAFVLRGASGMFHSIAWCPDGAQLAAANDDGQIWIWNATRGFERDTTARAVPFVDKLVASGTARGEDLHWCAESYVRAGRPATALALIKDDPYRLCDLARQLAGQGHAALANEARTKARALLEQQIAADTENAAAASELANILLMDTTSWTILRPTEMRSKGGSNLALRNDGSILASGNNVSGDVYTLTVATDLDRIAAIRLEVLSDSMLPNKGPGRHSTGNFQLSAFRLFQAPSGSADGPLPLTLDSASASYDFKAKDADIAGTINEELKKYWHVWGRLGESHEAIFLLQKPSPAGQGRHFIIELRHRDFTEPINLGRFRLSVLAVIPKRDRKRVAALTLADPWTRLAAAYHLLGSQERLDALLKQHPPAATAVGDLAAAEGDWEQAIAEYSIAISNPATNSIFLVRRALAYEATNRWNLAMADWARAAPQQLELVFARARRLVQSGVNAYENGRRASAISELRQARDLFRALHQVFPEDARVASQLGISSGFLGSALRDENRAAEARASIDESRKALETIRQPSSMDLYNIACAYSNLSVLEEPGKASPTDAERKHLIDRAMDSLERAIAAGMTDLSLIDTDHDLDPLRVRPEFRRFMLTQLARTSAANPKDLQVGLKVAALQAWFGQEKEFAITRQRILEVAMNTNDAREADCAAKVCSMLPSASKVETEKALLLGRRAVEYGKNSPLLPWFQLALGMAAYRSGDDSAAQESLLAAATAAADNSHVRCTSAMYRSMSLFRQGRKDEARKVASEAVGKMSPLPKDENNPMADGANHDDVILWLAYREAKALINFEAAPRQKQENSKK